MCCSSAWMRSASALNWLWVESWVRGMWVEVKGMGCGSVCCMDGMRERGDVVNEGLGGGRLCFDGFPDSGVVVARLLDEGCVFGGGG